MLGLEPLQLLVLAIGVLITGISKSGFAGGLGVITVPILSLVMNPLLAVALMLPTLILMDAMSVKAWWGKHSIALLRILVPAGIVGVLIGYLAFSYVNEAQIKLILGFVTLVFGINGLVSQKSRSPHNDNAGRVFGLIGGFTSFVAHAGGPPLNFYLLSKKLDKATYLGTAVIFFAAINLAKVPPYIEIGQFTHQNVIVALAFAPVSFLGIRIGIWLQNKIDESAFFRVIYWLLAGLGAYLIWHGLR